MAYSQFLQNESLAVHTTFRTGGQADYYIRPAVASFLPLAIETLKKAQTENIPFFILGGGANVLVSDSGFRGIIFDTTDFSGCLIKQDGDGAALIVKAGTKSDDVAEFAARNALAGVEFLAGLPGTIGGAVWMNARCYDRSVSDVLGNVTILDEAFNVQTILYNHEDYSYKKSPFQKRQILILEVCLHVKPGDKTVIETTMAGFRQDRAIKKQLQYPSAGSVFKNNHLFGKPSGKIIEELGLRGAQIGGARIADWHGNFIINTGNAVSADIYALIQLVQETAKKQLGIDLEPEVIFLGF